MGLTKAYNKMFKSRKERRMDAKKQKKERKQHHFEEKKKSGKKASLKTDLKGATRKNKFSKIKAKENLFDEKVHQTKVLKKAAKSVNTLTYQDKMAQAREKEENKRRAYEAGLKEQRLKQLEEQNKDEDRIISKYEKLLKLNRKKGKKDTLSTFDDGLDYILELCTEDNVQKMYSAAKEAAEADESEDEANIKEKRLKEIEEKYFGEDQEPSNPLSLDDFINSDDDEFSNSGDESKVDTSDFEEDFEAEPKKRNFVMAPSASEDEEGQQVDLGSKEQNSRKKKFLVCESDNEDNEIAALFKNKRSNKKRCLLEPADEENLDADLVDNDKERNMDEEEEGSNECSKKGKYVPPALRDSEFKDHDNRRQEQLNKIRRILKGQLNRLSEANMHKITAAVESMYMQNARNDMNTSLTALISESLVSNVLAKERLVLEHMLLIAILHANIGNEIGAFFLENICNKLIELLKDIESINVEDKTLDNYIFIICHLYTFKLIQHNMIFEILKRLNARFCEKSVECLLLILRSVGFNLRKDDPVSLKALIIEIQKQANVTSSTSKERDRVKFMLDTLLAIKNNNVTKIPQYDPTLSDHFRKLLKGGLMATGKYITTLTITINDLLNVEKRGKWWLVGSAWMGKNESENGCKVKSKSNGDFSEQLLELARKQRMNTEDRKTIFCIIMSAEDHIDAFEKILHLGIKDQKVVVSVIIHCALSEKTFNPYYAVLAQKFIAHDRKFFLAFQFSLWDKIREISSQTAIQVKNLGSFLLYLIKEGELPLSVLKIIQFAEIDMASQKLVKQIMLGLLLADEETFSTSFSRVAVGAKLKHFRDCIKLFMHHFMQSQQVEKKLSSEDKILLKQRIKLADELLICSERLIKL